MSTYTVHVQENKADRDTLGDNNYNLQVAKSVAGPPGTTPTFNVVYKSKDLGPDMSVTWVTQYGLNWTTDIPSVGDSVNYSGVWQECNLGDSYSLNQDASWSLAENNQHADSLSLNVASNDYTENVHILVGVQDPVSQTWTTVSHVADQIFMKLMKRQIWFGNDKLLRSGHGEYKPVESVRIWYQETDLSETMISDEGTITITKDITNNPTWYFNYLASVTPPQKPEWQNSAVAFPITD